VNGRMKGVLVCEREREIMWKRERERLFDLEKEE